MDIFIFHMSNYIANITHFQFKSDFPWTFQWAFPAYVQTHFCHNTHRIITKHPAEIHKINSTGYIS